MKVLYQTDRVHTSSSQMSDGDRSDGEARFDLILHEGPPDPATWEGCGQAIAYWRGQFERLREPYPWTVSAA